MRRALVILSLLAAPAGAASAADCQRGCQNTIRALQKKCAEPGANKGGCAIVVKELEQSCARDCVANSNKPKPRRR